jgi:hypothetical protein
VRAVHLSGLDALAEYHHLPGRAFGNSKSRGTQLILVLGPIAAVVTALVALARLLL